MSLFDEPSMEDLQAAQPSSLSAAENGKVKTAIEVLSQEAKHCESDWMSEELSAVALYLEQEVL